MLTKGEADRLRAAGLDIVSNFESWTGRAREGFAAGVEDAIAAVGVTVAAGGPIRPVIYFSVDEDVSGAAVAPYFKGIASVIGVAYTGAYGSYRVIKYLFDNCLMTYGWQTYAWSSGQWDSRAQIRQTKNGVQVCGGDTDIDEIHADRYGGWSEAEDDVNLTDKVTLPQWVVDAFKDDPGIADGSILVQTALGGGYAYGRLANAKADALTKELAAVKAVVTGLSTGGVDLDALVAKLAPAVADLLAQRLRD
jgi:hypothetical protein